MCIKRYKKYKIQFEISKLNNSTQTVGQYLISMDFLDYFQCAGKFFKLPKTELTFESSLFSLISLSIHLHWCGATFHRVTYSTLIQLRSENIRSIWPKVWEGHCTSCIVHIFWVHSRPSVLTRNMISIRTLDLADLLSMRREREREKRHYSDTEHDHPIIRHPGIHDVPASVDALLRFAFAFA